MDDTVPSTSSATILQSSPPKRRKQLDLGHLTLTKKQAIVNMYKQSLIDQPTLRMFAVVDNISVAMGSQCLKDVKLNIEPATVKLYHDTILHCTYDLEGASLYSVKWYRGQREFYRYNPSESTKVKVFGIEGFTVDEAASNSTQVYLRNISDFKHSGNFSCEVTADGNTVFERRDEQTMQVVQLPEHEPKISVGRDPLDVGDILKANCSSPPSKPRAEMTMSLNNFVIKMSDLSKQKPVSHPDWSDLSVEIKLTEHYFKDNGDLKLECVAKVAGIYSDNAVLFLESARRHPVPERVSYNIASVVTNNTAIFLIAFVYLNLVLG